jgi:hypothetical protein
MTTPTAKPSTATIRAAIRILPNVETMSGFNSPLRRIAISSISMSDGGISTVGGIVFVRHSSSMDSTNSATIRSLIHASRFMAQPRRLRDRARRP